MVAIIMEGVMMAGWGNSHGWIDEIGERRALFFFVPASAGMTGGGNDGGCVRMTAC